MVTSGGNCVLCCVVTSTLEELLLQATKGCLQNQMVRSLVLHSLPLFKGTNVTVALQFPLNRSASYVNSF